MDKQTLSNYGWIVICILVLSVMIALATPFGNFIASGIKSTTQGLFDTIQEAVNNVGFGQIADQEFEGHYTGNGTGGGGGGGNTPSIPCEHDYEATTTATCTQAGTTTYTCKLCGNSYSEDTPAGHNFDNASDMTCDECNTKFTSYSFTASDYDRKMGTTTKTDAVVEVPETFVYNGVKYKTTSIGYQAFYKCNTLKNIDLPDSIISLGDYAFSGCSSLTSIVIPNNVTAFGWYVFQDCTSLTEVSAIPNGVTNISYAFEDCVALLAAPVMPDSITDMQYAFSGCTSLTTISAIPSNVTNMTSSFANCTSLKTVPAIPNGVTNMSFAFQHCTSLENAPTIPSSATNMSFTFYGCKSLTGTIELPCTLIKENYTYSSCPANVTYYCVDGCDGYCYCNIGLHTIEETICSVCGKTVCELNIHSIENNKCNLCGFSVTTIESEHSPYLNDQNYVVLGTWDYSDATSVTITIKYQTESASFDWVSVTEGTNYTAGSSYSETRNYLTTDGTITSTTGAASNIKFGGTVETTKTFENVDMLTGSIIFKTDGLFNTYYGVLVTIMPNYD